MSLLSRISAACPGTIEVGIAIEGASPAYDTSHFRCAQIGNGPLVQIESCPDASGLQDDWLFHVDFCFCFKV